MFNISEDFRLVPVIGQGREPSDDELLLHLA